MTVWLPARGRYVLQTAQARISLATPCRLPIAGPELEDKLSLRYQQMLNDQSDAYLLCAATHSVARLRIMLAPEVLNKVVRIAARAHFARNSGLRKELLQAFAIFGHPPGDRRQGQWSFFWYLFAEMTSKS